MVLYFASNNSNKFGEVESIFNQLLPEITIKSIADTEKKVQASFSPEETGKTFLENSWIKARSLSRLLPGHFVIAEDSGLVIPVLKGAPGIRSSRYGKNDPERIKRVLDEMRNLKNESRRACFFASVCFLDVNSRGNIIFFQGKLQGTLSYEPKGNNGFGYDPIFYLPGIQKTLAELSAHEKQNHSHRRKAFERLIRFIQKTYLKSYHAQDKNKLNAPSFL